MSSYTSGDRLTYSEYLRLTELLDLQSGEKGCTREINNDEITAGKKAFIDAVQKAKPVLLEPFVKLHIAIPTDMIGDISSDISGRRGRILGTEMLPGDQALLEAEAPLSEVMSYTSQLKSITGGTGSYEMEYSHDERTPANVQADVVKAFNPKDDE